MNHRHETEPMRVEANEYFTVQRCLVGLSLSENMGDVADYLPWLADAVGVGRPEWCDECERYIWPWEEDDPSDYFDD